MYDYMYITSFRFTFLVYTVNFMDKQGNPGPAPICYMYRMYKARLGTQIGDAGIHTYCTNAGHAPARGLIHT
jgi:hypothetical protein